MLIRQFRYTMDDWYWEVPAGGFHDFDGSPIELARRELAEEIGGTSDDWCYAGSFRPGNSIIDALYHVVLAAEAFLDLRPRCYTVLIGGLSISSHLTVHLAARHDLPGALPRALPDRAGVQRTAVDG